MKIFKTADPKQRDKMNALGFAYTTEHLNRDDVWYCFLIPEEEAEKLASCFEHGAFFVGQTLAF